MFLGGYYQHIDDDFPEAPVYPPHPNCDQTPARKLDVDDTGTTHEQHWSPPDDPFKLAFESLVATHRQSPYG